MPGLYGYVSATKWITEIELTTLEAFDAYWVPLGWSKEAPILTQSRIDVPRPSSQVAAGRVEAAGVAWAPTRGIAKVEVLVDQAEPWHEAELSVPLSTCLVGSVARRPGPGRRISMCCRSGRPMATAKSKRTSGPHPRRTGRAATTRSG